jgi:hypothetical protein
MLGNELDLLQMSLDQDGALERALCSHLGRFRGRLPLVLRLLLLYTDEHFGEEIAFQVLPRLAIFAYANSAMKQQPAKSKNLMSALNQKICEDTKLP